MSGIQSVLQFQMSGAMQRPEPAAEGSRLAADAATVHLGAGMGLLDPAFGASDCGQYPILTCRGDPVALMGAMGSDVAIVEFPDASRYREEEVMDRVAARG